jgi:isocitrate dehydrogenase (NAD+)
MYAQVRPCKPIRRAHRYADSKVDLVIVRENTEDLYAGIEFERGSDGRARSLRRSSGPRACACATTPGSRSSPSPRRARAAWCSSPRLRPQHRPAQGDLGAQGQHHEAHGRPWLEVSRQVAAENSDVEFEDRIVDNMCMQLVQKPELYDVLVLPNLTATSSPTSEPASSAAWASHRAGTSAWTRRCSSRRTARRRSTPARTG